MTVKTASGVAPSTPAQPSPTAATPPPASTPPGTPPNSAPSITGTAASAVIQGVEYSFTPSSDDPDSDPLTFLIEHLPDWATFDATTGSLRGTPGAHAVGATAAIRIGVSDGKDTVWLPAFSINVLPPTVVITGTKPANLEWDRLSVGKRLYLDDTPTFTRVPGQYRGLTYVRTVNADRSANAAVTIEFEVDRPVDVLVGFDARVSNLPLWLQSWTATGTSVAAGNLGHKLYGKRFERGVVRLGGNEVGFSMYSVVVDDGTGTGNSAPAISGNPPAAIGATREYTFLPSATDIDGDPLTFSARNLPAWARLDPATGRLVGTPTQNQVGTYDGVVIDVSDGQSTASLPPFRIAVSPVNSNSPPAISGQPVPLWIRTRNTLSCRRPATPTAIRCVSP